MFFCIQSAAVISFIKNAAHILVQKNKQNYLYAPFFVLTKFYQKVSGHTTHTWVLLVRMRVA
jgi:hypothetical protein